MVRTLCFGLAALLVVGCSEHPAHAVPGRTPRATAAPPTPAGGRRALRDNFTLSEFRAALAGSWQSVFTYPNRGNILSASFDGDECRLLIADGVGDAHVFAGPYEVELERPFDGGSVTFVRITVESDRGRIELGRVNFGDHNGVLSGRNPFLRIDTDPYGVLELRAP